MTRLFIYLCIAAVTQGCASLEDTRKSLVQAKLCCHSVESLPYRVVALNKIEEVSVDTKSPVFEFEDGRSFFAAFEVPPVENGRVQILTRLHEDAPGYSYVFLPAVRFLNADFQPVGKIDNPYWFPANALFEPAYSEHPFWGGVVNYSAPVRYMILYSPKSALARTVTHHRHSVRVSPVPLAGGGFGTIFGGPTVSSNQVPNYGIGELKLRVIVPR